MPASLRVGPRHVRVGASSWTSTLVVTGYPRDVHAGWLQPLTGYPGRVDVSVHVTPIDPATATTRLQRQLARLESGRRSDADHGRLLDPYAEAATEDAYTLADRVARGEGRLFQVALTLTVHAHTEDALTTALEEVRALAASMLIDARPTTYRALPAWVSGLPLGLDRLGHHRTFDTDALAAAFPLASPELPTTSRDGGGVVSGVLYGHNLGTRSLVFWDRFTCDNYNAVILGRSGAGKSYLVKLELLRSLYRGVDAHVIDPEDEYTRLAAAIGAVVIRPGSPGVHLNPFDLPLTTRSDGTCTAPRDAFTRRALFLHTFLAVLLDEPLSAIDRAVLDTAITATYAAAGITADPTTWTQPAPLLADLRDTLHTFTTNPDTATSSADPVDAAAPGHPGSERDTSHSVAAVEAAQRLAAMLHPFTDGAFRSLFDGPTSRRPQAHLVVWAFRDLPEQLRSVATLLALDSIWTTVTNPADCWPRLIVVDEAWLLMQQPAGAQFLLRAAKAARKHWAGLTIATQDTADVLGTDLGRAVVANAATQVLLRQAPQAIDAVTDAFHLSSGERAFLLSADRGQALLSAGRHRVAFQAFAADAEHDLITTDPAERAAHTDRDDEHQHIVLLSNPAQSSPDDPSPMEARPRTRARVLSRGPRR